jgi:hypothetical protein
LIRGPTGERKTRKSGKRRKAAVGFEPTNNGFANRRLRPLGYAASNEEPYIQACAGPCKKKVSKARGIFAAEPKGNGVVHWEDVTMLRAGTSAWDGERLFPVSVGVLK